VIPNTGSKSSIAIARDSASAGYIFRTSEAEFAALTCFTGAGTFFTGVGGLRGAPLAAFPGIETCDCWRLGCAALAAGFVKPCGGSVLDGTALRTGAAGPPGPP
jgi:hypothetical protein